MLVDVPFVGEEVLPAEELGLPVVLPCVPLLGLAFDSLVEEDELGSRLVEESFESEPLFA